MISRFSVTFSAVISYFGAGCCIKLDPTFLTKLRFRVAFNLLNILSFAATPEWGSAHKTTSGDYSQEQLKVGMIFSSFAEVSLWLFEGHKSKLPQASPVQGEDLKSRPHNMAVEDKRNQQRVKEKGGEMAEVVEEQIGQVLTLVCCDVYACQERANYRKLPLY